MPIDISHLSNDLPPSSPPLDATTSRFARREATIGREATRPDMLDMLFIEAIAVFYKRAEVMNVRGGPCFTS